MTIRTILHVTAAQEPAEFHDLDPETDAVFAVSLALEVTGDETKAMDKSEAEAAVGAFFEALGGLTFHRVDADSEVAEPLDRLILPKSPAPDLAKWLKDAEGRIAVASGGDPAFYLHTHGEREAELRNISAFELQSTAARWPAPAAQNAGLVTAVSMPVDDAAKRPICIVAIPEGADPDNITVENAGGDPITLTIPWIEEGETISAACGRLLADEAKPLPNMFQPTGHVTLPLNPQALAALLDRIADRMPTEMWTAPVMQALMIELAAPPPAKAELPEEETAATEERYAAIRDWLARALPYTTLDLPILGLRHGAVSGRVPAILALLVATVAEEVEAIGPDHALDDVAFLTAVDANLADLDLFEHAETHFGLDTDRWPTVSIALRASAGDFAGKKDRAALAAEVSDLLRTTEAERDLEDWLVAVLSAATVDHDQFESKFANVVTGPESVEGEADKKTPAVRDGVAAFIALLTDRIDAAAVIRADVGAALQDMMLSEVLSNEVPPVGPDKIAGRVIGLAPLSGRSVETDAGAPLEALFEVLPVLPPLPTEVETQDILLTRLRDIWAPRAASIVTPPEADADRFRPDLAPQSLHLPFVRAASSEELVAITENISGIASLLAMEGAEPAHLNLVSMRFADGSSVATVDPAMPIGGGSASAPTLPYSGDPLSSPNRDSPAGADAGAPGLTPEDLRPFTLEDANYKDAAADAGPEFEQVPTLAYGTTYRSTAFWVPPSGVLPMGLRARDESDPFAPTAEGGKLQTFADAGPTSEDIPYRRRTAISEMRVQKVPSRSDRHASLDLRLGQVPEDVHALAVEEPRILVTPDGRWRGLYRRPDGSGMLAPADGQIKVTLERVHAAPDDILSVEVWRGGTLVAEATEFAFGRPHRLSDKELGLALPESEAGKDGYWLRLRSAKAAVSFADPAAGREDGAIAPPPAPVLLLAPSAKNWRITDTAQIKVNWPRVSFTDFDRWARNAAAMEEVAGGNGDEIARLIRRTRTVLIATGSPRVDEINRLPDPAVTGVLIGAAVTHRTAEVDPEVAVTQTVFRRPYDGLKLNPIATDDKKLRELAEDNLDRIRDNAEIYLDLKAADTLAFNAGPKIKCPRGAVTRLWLSPLVPHDLRDMTLSSHLKALEVGDLKVNGTEFAAFDGPKISVEVARGVNAEADRAIARRALGVRDHGRARSYSLDVALPEDNPRGALFSSAIVTTQRWRPTGLPLTTFVAPAPVPTAKPVVEIAANTTNLERFEAEAFLDEEGARRLVRLEGGGLTTEAERVDWPERSATYLRHALKLRSRYAPLDLSGETEVFEPDPLHDQTEKWPAWVRRVAVLADPLRSAITRPQVRSYLPALRRPAESARQPAPPMLCILAEPPYAQLGLAERIDAEIRMTQIYGFAPRPTYTEAKEGANDSARDDADGKNQILSLKGLRKEAGGDPILTPLAIGEERSRAATLKTLGVLGLSFDAPGVPSPAFSNSLLRITLDVPEAPEATAGEVENIDLEEAFFAITLRRRASLDWSVSHPVAESNRAPDDVASKRLSDQHEHWIRRKEEDGIAAFDLVDPKTEVTVVAAQANGVKVRGQALFPVAEAATYKDELFAVWDAAWKAALISSEGDGRWRIALFGPREGGGLSALASISFEAPEGLKFRTVGGGPVPIATRSSEDTGLAWVRTARDMSRLYLADGSSDVAVADLAGRTVGDLVSLHLAGGALAKPDQPSFVVPPAAARPITRYVQRRLGQILLWPTPQVGHKRLVARATTDADPLAETGVVALCGGDGRAEHRHGLTEGATDLQLVELEIPARPVRSGADPAYFDLVSTGASRVQSRTFRFHLRGGSGPILTDGLRIRLEGIGGETDWSAEVVWEDVIGHETDALRWLDVVLRPGDPAADPAALEFVWTDNAGTRRRKPVLKLDKPLPFGVTALTFGFISGDAVWADVSLLHTARPMEEIGPDGLDFDWIFGPHSDVTRDPVADLDPIRLARLKEAQATIRALSAPIPIAGD